MTDRETSDTDGVERATPGDSEGIETQPSEGAEKRPAGARAFGRAYWMLNAIEAGERLAYFGIRAVVPIYIMQATEPGGLHLSAVHKGWIYMWWAIFQSFLPIVTGGLADRYGYKRVLGGAISANVVGYLMMAFLTSYYGFFAGILVLAVGTSFFKPSLQGSLAQNLTKESSSLGWGIFYWVVNVGGFAAPLVSTAVLGQPHSAAGWRNLFLVSAGFTTANLALLFTFKDVPSGASKTETVGQVLVRTLKNIVEPRLIAWLAIMSCFWLMMYQLWDLHPNFIEDWVDSAAVARAMPFDSWREYGDRGLLRVPQQILLSLNPGLIILLVVPVSYLVRKMRTLSAMLIGMAVAIVGILLGGLSANGWLLLSGIVFFSLGEMLTGPKKTEYLGLIAPPGKKGMYLGYVNIPVGVGVAIGSLVAGLVYDDYGEKATLALKYLGSEPQLVGRAARLSDWSDDLAKVAELTGVARQDALATVAKELGTTEAQAAALLTDAYRFDRGQLVNLALQQVALHPDYRQQVAAALGAEPTEDLVAASVGKLAKATGVRGTDALALAGAQLGGGQPLGEAALAEALWARFGAGRENRNNLALEYLAQATARLEQAVGKLSLPNPVADIAAKVGIGRTKSFDALSAALGASEAEVAAELARSVADVTDPSLRAAVYLMRLPHLRFLAVARLDWARDLPALRRLVEADGRALGRARERRPGRDGGVDFAALAEDQDDVQRVLAELDWSRAPTEAARILGRSRFEAIAMVGSEMKHTRLTTTRLLWDRYDPQYHTWIPFALIGLVATVALGLFGWRAKRWTDMNA